MKKNIFVMSIVLLLLTGCTSVPVQNISQEQVPVPAGGERPSMNEVENAIITAAKKQGWMPRIVRPGLIEAGLSVRTHSATIEIPYTRNAFSINYKDSSELDYKDGNIHRNYNKWVTLLSRAIQEELL